MQRVPTGTVGTVGTVGSYGGSGRAFASTPVAVAE